MKLFLNNRQTAEGFTLIEIVMVLVLTGILGSVAAAKYFDMRDKAAEQACLANRAALQSEVRERWAGKMLDGATPTEGMVEKIFNEEMTDKPVCPGDGKTAYTVEVQSDTQLVFSVYCRLHQGTPPLTAAQISQTLFKGTGDKLFGPDALFWTKTFGGPFEPNGTFHSNTEISYHDLTKSPGALEKIKEINQFLKDSGAPFDIWLLRTTGDGVKHFTYPVEKVTPSSVRQNNLLMVRYYPATGEYAFGTGSVEPNGTILPGSSSTLGKIPSHQDYDPATRYPTYEAAQAAMNALLSGR